MSWQWLENPARPARWGMMSRVALKALILFALVNIAYAALAPLDALGRVSVYNWLVPGLDRIALNYRVAGNADAISATSDIPTLINAHRVSAPKAGDEFRILVLGDSATRASTIIPGQTVTSVLSAANITLQDGRRIVAYNLAYPHPSLLKDFLLLEEALHQETKPDAVLWMMTLNSALSQNQLSHPIVQDNLSTDYAWLALDTGITTASNTPATLLTWENMLIGQSRPLADWLRLQVYGFTWAATRHDSGGNPRYTLRGQSINPENLSTNSMNQPAEFFTFEIIDAVDALLEDIPLIIINEPIYRVDDPNNALILNQYYRRDVYEHYQRVIQDYADAQGWRYADLWDAIPPEHFTNTPLHYDAQGARILAERLADIIPQMLTEESR